jgi:hypothetical protein
MVLPKIICISNRNNNHKLTINKMYDSHPISGGTKTTVYFVQCDDGKFNFIPKRKFREVDDYKNELIKIRFAK